MNEETDRERRAERQARKEREDRDQARVDAIRAEEKEKKRAEEVEAEVLTTDKVLPVAESTSGTTTNEAMIVEGEAEARADSPVISIKGGAAGAEDSEMDTTAAGDEAIEY